MTPEAHIAHLLTVIAGEATIKYLDGFKRHGGHLERKRGQLKRSVEEVLDLAIYLYSLRDQIGPEAQKLARLANRPELADVFAAELARWLLDTSEDTTG